VWAGKREMLWPLEDDENAELFLNSRGEEGRDGHLVREWEEDVDEVEEDEVEDRLEMRIGDSSSKRERTGEVVG